MPNYEIRITAAAYDDLTGIVDYIAGENPCAAVQLADEIEQRIQALSDFPEMGVVPKPQRLSRKGYRVLIVSDYLIFYVLLNKCIEIRRIFSGKRNYLNLL